MLDSVQSVLAEQIKDLYNAENQLVKALPQIAKAAATPALRLAINAHLEETRGHVERLEKIAEILEMKPGGRTCKGMEGLLAEGKEVLEEEGQDAACDAAIIAAAQRVEHYEIAGYGTARAFAERLGQQEIVDLLSATLEEEKAADRKLTEISIEEVLPSVSQTAPSA